MLSGRGITGGPAPSGSCGMGAIRVGMGLTSGQRITPGKPLVFARSPAEASGKLSGPSPGIPGACPPARFPGGAVAAAGAAQHIRNHAADGHSDGEQHGQRESQKRARHALGRLGLDASRGKREDSGQGSAGGEGEARQGGMLQQHGAYAGLQGDGDSKPGAEFAKEIALR